MKILPGDLVFLINTDPETSYIVLGSKDILIHVIDDETGDEFVTTTNQIQDVLPISDELEEYDDLNLFLTDVVEDIEDTPRLIEQLRESGGEIEITSKNITIKVTHERDTTT